MQVLAIGISGSIRNCVCWCASDICFLLRLQHWARWIERFNLRGWKFGRAFEHSGEAKYDKNQARCMLDVLFRLLCNNISLEQQSCCAAIGEVFPSKRHEGHQSEAQPLHCKATSELARCVICGVASSSHTSASATRCHHGHAARSHSEVYNNFGNSFCCWQCPWKCGPKLKYIGAIS